jgi:hypothetical protein
VKNTIAIESIPIIMDEPDDIDIDPSVAVGIDMPDMVAVVDSAAIDILILMLIPLMLSIFVRDYEPLAGLETNISTSECMSGN